MLLITRFDEQYLNYSNPKSFMQICRGGAPVPALRKIGQPRGDCPYKNYANDLGSLYIRKEGSRIG